MLWVLSTLWLCHHFSGPSCHHLHPAHIKVERTCKDQRHIFKFLAPEMVRFSSTQIPSVKTIGQSAKEAREYSLLLFPESIHFGWLICSPKWEFWVTALFALLCFRSRKYLGVMSLRCHDFPFL